VGEAVIQALVRGNSETCFLLDSVTSAGTFELLFDRSGIGGSDCTAAAASLDSLLISIFMESGNSISLSAIDAIRDNVVFIDGFEGS